MAGLAGVLGKPRTQAVTLENGAELTIGELSVADTWPYINGEPVDPENLIRASVIDPDTGGPALGPHDKITMAVALELLPIIMKFNEIETAGADEGAPDFPRAASSE